MSGKPWGSIIVGTRLEKQVEAGFFLSWSNLLMKGLQPGDGALMERGKPAHEAANGLIRRFLKETKADSLLFLDSDAEVDKEFLNVLRNFEPGWEYDALQAFHTRRGWPPEPIWFKEVDGVNMQCIVLEEGTEEVAMVGTHAAIFRREIFEAIYEAHGEGILFEDFQWFCYPRHVKMSDETTLSVEARKLGFRLGATTEVKVGHISRVVTGWDTYHEYLELSGTLERYQAMADLASEVAEFTGEDRYQVIAKAVNGPRIAGDIWAANGPRNAEQTRRYYEGDYFYKIILWNVTPTYNTIIEPLRREYAGLDVLVVGSGLGTEAGLLAQRNNVTCFDLPGKGRDFARHRLGDKVSWLEGPRLPEALDGRRYDMVVAIDVIEHFHPDEFDETMEAIAGALRPGGLLYAHNNFTEPGHPEHFDHTAVFAEWQKRCGFTHEDEYVYRKTGVPERVPAQRA